MKIKKISPINLILIFLTIAASVKVACCGWIIDEGYAFAIGNRLLQGDLLFKDMWELHQTSGFAVEFFLGLYRTLTHSNDGEILFVRACGMLLHLAVSVFLFFALKKHTSDKTAFLMAVIYANLSPKQLSTPEFSNLFNLTSTMTLICTDRLLALDDSFLKKKKGIALSVLSGMFLSVCVLSYPQSLIFALFVFILVLRSGKKFRINFFIIASVCLLSGAAYMANILSYMSVSELMTTFKNMIYVDSTHSEGVSKLSLYGINSVGVILFTLGFGLISYLAGRIAKDKKIIVPCALFLVFLWKFIHIAFKTDYYPMELTFGGILFVILIAMVYIFKNRLLTDRAKTLLTVYGGGSLAVFVTVLVACDQSIYSSAKYLTVGLVAVLSVIFEEEGSYKKMITYAAVIMVILVNIIQLNNPRNKLFNISDSGARVPYGPEKGLILERIYANKARIDADELPGLLNEAESVMITGDAVTYLYTDAHIGHGTTIMTEDYGIRFRSYWDMYPEKVPDIIAIECYDGELNADVESSWLYEYVTGEYGASRVVDTTYYRLYIR